MKMTIMVAMVSVDRDGGDDEDDDNGSDGVC